MPRPRAPVLSVLLAALACGTDRESPAPAAAPVDAAAELEAARLEVATLREALASEHAEREALEAEVDRLRAEADDSGWSGATSEADAQPGAANPARPWFDAKGLLERGVEPAEVDRVRESFDRSEMALLELEDRARRESWFGSPRYRDALRDARDSLRAELGDERFDLLLYASGRHNCVVVEDVLDGSPAQRAGIQPGDEILRYGDRRTFWAWDLKHQTTQGRPGEPVSIDIVRGGEAERLWGSYGPLGIRLREENRPPR
jgi:hypothetical protein